MTHPWHMQDYKVNIYSTQTQNTMPIKGFYWRVFFFLFNFPLPWNKLLWQHCVPGARRPSDYRAALVCPQWDGVFQNTRHMCWCLITLRLSCLLVSHWGIFNLSAEIVIFKKTWSSSLESYLFYLLASVFHRKGFPASGRTMSNRHSNCRQG